ncbi:hypothetical protein P4644_16130 [Priestia aryabhattai]|uniref:hypothetical protein n=1 Tax=Priestia aryabhattai TaxID=412384 RepID=UPI002E1DC4C5|nr:hypothetical protein [Priestia aryabhattai]
MKSFELLDKLQEEKAGKEAQVNSAQERVDEARAKVSELQEKHKELALKQATEGKNLTKDINKVLGDIRTAKDELEAREFELSVVEDVQEGATQYTEELISAEFSSYKAQFEENTLLPILDKLAESKKAYLDAIKEFNEARTFFNAQSKKADVELNKRIKEKGVSRYLPTFDAYTTMNQNKASFLEAQEIKPAGL